MRHLRLLLACALLLMGCGGGRTSYIPSNPSTPGTDGSGPPNASEISTPGEAQGFYGGTFDWGGVNFYAAVLPDDMYYEIYGRTNDDGSFKEVWGFMTGQGASKSGKYTADLTNFVIDESFAMTMGLTYVKATSITGSYRFQYTGATHGLAGQAIPASMLDYNLPASLSNITGAWTGNGFYDLLTGEFAGPSTYNIASDGTLTSQHDSCFVGMITPRASINLFDLTITAGGAPCSATTTTFKGIALEMHLSNGSSQLILVGNAEKTPLVFVAQRN